MFCWEFFCSLGQRRFLCVAEENSVLFLCLVRVNCSSMAVSGDSGQVHTNDAHSCVEKPVKFWFCVNIHQLFLFFLEKRTMVLAGTGLVSSVAPVSHRTVDVHIFTTGQAYIDIWHRHFKVKREIFGKKFLTQHSAPPGNCEKIGLLLFSWQNILQFHCGGSRCGAQNALGIPLRFRNVCRVKIGWKLRRRCFCYFLYLVDALNELNVTRNLTNWSIVFVIYH